MSDIRVFALSGIDYTAGTQTGYILAKDGCAILVDAAADLQDVREVLCLVNARLVGILLTHCHFDHTANAARLKAAFPEAPLYGSPMTNGMLLDGSWTADFVDYPTPSWRVDVQVREQVYEIGPFAVQVIFTPGHTLDSVCYLIDNSYLAAGDTIMNDLVCGNSNLPTGDEEELYFSGKKLWRLVPDEAFILGGHVSRPSDMDWDEYHPRATVGRAKHRNMINRL